MESRLCSPLQWIHERTVTVEACLLVLLISTNKRSRAPKRLNDLARWHKNVGLLTSSPYFTSVIGSYDKNIEFQKWEYKRMCPLTKSANVNPLPWILWVDLFLRMLQGAFLQLFWFLLTPTSKLKSPPEMTLSKYCRKALLCCCCSREADSVNAAQVAWSSILRSPWHLLITELPFRQLWPWRPC